MFSFFGSTNGSNSGKPASQSTTPVRETSASLSAPSYDPTKMQSFHQSTANVEDNKVSSFSFMTTPSTDGGIFGGMSVSDEPGLSETVISSGFSFLNSPEIHDEVREAPSGFSFMMGGASSIVDEEGVHIPPPIAGPPPFSEPDVLSMSDVPQQQDLKLNKIAATKVVKKKKKVARVGTGREDDEAASGRRGSIEPDEEVIEEQSITTHFVAYENPPIQLVVEEPSSDISAPPPPSYPPAAPPVLEILAVVREPSPEPIANEPSFPVHDNSDFLMNLGTTSFCNVGGMDVDTKDSASDILVNVDSSAPAHEPVEDSIVPSHLLRDVQKIDDTIRDSIVKIRSSYQTAYASQNYILRQIEDCHNQITGCKEKLACLDLKQANFAKQEEFDEAELITGEIEQVNKDLQIKLSLKEKLIEKLHKHRIDYEAEKSQLIKNFDKSFDGLSIVCEKTMREISLSKVKVDEFAEEERSRIEVEQQRIDLEKSHCDREQHTLDSESGVIEEAIKSQVGDFYAKKETTEVQLFAVQDEIRKLEEVLAQKRLEEAELSKSLKLVDNKIGEVRKKYDRQLHRIQERKDALSRSQRECEMEQEQVNRTTELLEKTISDAVTVVAEASEMIRWKQTESQASQWIVDDLHPSCGLSDDANAYTMAPLSLDYSWYGTVSDSILCDIVQDNQQHSKSDNDRLGDLHQAVEKKELEVAQVKGHVDEIHVKHELLVTRQKTVLETIERCEIAKKLHAANKRFKEAANSAKELKEATDLKEKLDQKIADSQVMINDAVKQLEMVESDLIKLKDDLKEFQRVEKLNHLNVISLRVGVCNYMVARLTRTIHRLMAESSGHSRVGLLTVALDLYRDEIDQLRKLQISLASACSIYDLDQYSKQFEINEPDQSFVSPEETNIDVNEQLFAEDAPEASTGFHFMSGSSIEETLQHNEHVDGVFKSNICVEDVVETEEMASEDHKEPIDSEVW